jgi:cytochrome c oxidase cbb3-type subunit 3
MEWLNLEDSVNALSLLGAAVIIVLTILIVGKYIKQMKDDQVKGEKAGYNFDGIDELKNDLPVGWASVYAVLIVWGFWYWFVGYPLNAYSQIGEYNDEVKMYQDKYQAKWSNASSDTLKQMGQSLFLVQCAPCHGETAEGMGGKAANLVEWGKEEGIMSSIAKGQKGLGYPLGEMPAGLLPDAASAKAVAAYVMSEVSAVKKTKYPDLVETGRALWATCAACHGEDGAGMGGAAPDLTKYGTGDFMAVVLDKGKKGHIGKMPSFNNMLTDVQYKALGEYVYSLN